MQLEQHEVKRNRQIERERGWIDEGAEEYKEARKNRSEAYLPPGIGLTINLMEPVVEGVTKFCLGTNTQQKAERLFLSNFVPEEVASITIQICIDAIAIGKEKGRRTNLAIKIAEQLETKLNFDRLVKHAKAKDEEAKAAGEKKSNSARFYEKAVCDYRNYHLKRWATKKYLAREGVELVELPTRQKLKIGGRLIYIFANQTRKVKVKKFKRGDDRYSTYYIIPTDELLKDLERQHEKCALLNTMLRPMILSPQPWTSKTNGGYLTTFEKKIWLVKHQDPQGCQVGEDRECPRECIECKPEDPKDCYRCEVTENQKPGRPEFLEINHAPEVYEAINTVQDTAWRINRKVYEVMSKVWRDGGGEEWELPYREDKPLPLCPQCKNPKDRNHPCFVDKEVKKEWSKLARPVHEENDRNKSKRTGMRKKLQIAEECLGEPEIYFPYNFDFRGRMYPLPLFVNPQADDTGRALLEFATGKPVAGEAVKWLKVHGANCYGRDKESIAHRIAWVEKKQNKIRKVAKDPFNYKWWLKADDSWQFLAWCYDYSAWLADSENHRSHLPIAVDGKCNGLQHYAALLKDLELGRAVSLTASGENDKPGDIYQIVADLVSDTVKTDAVKGDKRAQLWLDKDDKSKVERKIVKKAVMNYPYGISDWKVWKEISKAVKEIEKKTRKKIIEIPDHLKEEDITYKDAITYLRGIVVKITKEVAASAGNVMDWLKLVSTLPNVLNHYGWVSPIGFNVSHMYYEEISPPPVKIRPEGSTKTERFKYKVRTFHVDKKKVERKMPPNFIHSLDAAHLMLTVLKCKAVGIESFGMVHDSYATHAANIPLMLRLLKEAFVDLHSMDVLADFRGQVMGELEVFDEVDEEEVIDWGDGNNSVLPSQTVSVDGEEYLQEIEKKLKHPLRRGDLNINDVLESAYFFA